MGDRYVYTDSGHDSLLITAHTDTVGAPVAAVKTGGTVYVTRDALPRVTAALYEATGLPAPIILERPELAGTHTMFANGIRVGPERDALEITGGTLPLELARVLAAHIVARAEQIEPEPDPADVEALSQALNRIWETYDGTSAEMARAILRAGYRPPERPS